MQRDHLDADIEVLPARSVLRDYQSEIITILIVWPRSSSSQLTRSVRELSASFEHRLFLTATPHNGHSNSLNQ
jgi:hypothetical protein